MHPLSPRRALFLTLAAAKRNYTNKGASAGHKSPRDNCKVFVSRHLPPGSDCSIVIPKKENNNRQVQILFSVEEFKSKQQTTDIN
jgi:hypothetical protein